MTAFTFFPSRYFVSPHFFNWMLTLCVKKKKKHGPRQAVASNDIISIGQSWLNWPDDSLKPLSYWMKQQPQRKRDIVWTASWCPSGSSKPPQRNDHALSWNSHSTRRNTWTRKAFFFFYFFLLKLNTDLLAQQNFPVFFMVDGTQPPPF